MINISLFVDNSLALLPLNLDLKSIKIIECVYTTTIFHQLCVDYLKCIRVVLHEYCLIGLGGCKVASWLPWLLSAIYVVTMQGYMYLLSTEDSTLRYYTITDPKISYVLSSVDSKM